LAKEFDNIKLIRDAYYTLYEINSTVGSYKQALDYHIQYTLLKDSLLNEETTNRFVEMEVKYETDKKAREIEDKQKAVERLEMEKKQDRSYFFVISGLILILLIVIFSRYRAKQKANKLLSEKNEQIVKQSTKMKVLIKQLKDSEKMLKEANITKDKFFSIIAHDLKNPLQTLLLSSDLLVRFRHKFTQVELEEKLFFIRKTSKQISSLLDSLLQWARTQTGKIEYNPKKLDLNLILLENVNLMSSSAFKKNISIISEIKENTVAYADENMVKTILRNLMSNAIKFTPQNGYVTISSREKNGFVEISVIDTGIGISQEDLPKLFRIDVHHTTIGTSNEKGTGLGLILCKEFVEKNGGTITVKSTIDEGSTFTFQLPINPIEQTVSDASEIISAK
jgi:signal transduction histidine kinase